jgi:hypothetical protein
MSMLINAKTKLTNQNHLQNSLKAVNRVNPDTLHRMMHPDENTESVMQRVKKEDDRVSQDPLVNLNAKLRKRHGLPDKAANSGFAE